MLQTLDKWICEIGKQDFSSEKIRISWEEKSDFEEILGGWAPATIHRSRAQGVSEKVSVTSSEKKRAVE